MNNLKLSRPLAIIDLETTSVDTSIARIVEISVMKIAPEFIEGSRHDGSTYKQVTSMNASVKTRRLNPRCQIPAEATAIHGITNEDVKDCPKFEDVAISLMNLIGDCDIAGYNLKRFDLQVLSHELSRCGLELDLEFRAVVDVQEIFFQKEPRDLASALRFYLGPGETHSAHSAEGDVLATAKILNAMIERYQLPQAFDQLAASVKDPEEIDIGGNFKRRADGVIVFNFGKHLGKPAAEERGYLHWMLDKGDFLPDTRRICRRILNPCEE